MSEKNCGFVVNNQTYQCAFQVAIDILDGKWKGLILWYLMQGPKRNSELRRLIPPITQKMLTQKLRQLEEEGVVIRTVYPVVPPKVDYRLTGQGERLKPVLELLYEWGADYIEARQAQDSQGEINEAS
ncbi:winged helix-turn-helix transcriptional regulator [Hydrogenovibrio thermophilus]|jgi:Predicted transcriptional regulators|uniref:Transcriptional regulator n=1 Tax=Hydrogenovibrio thermophilus TaxID=265883 RepID=A0A410H2T9_9GAMM|nr:helix-turn-helix domain-containing protein [Hydrogenovibrio thermophilus]QAB15239.1 transcriptional regulator [Hydrogenovibrio thermophilus]